MRVTSSLAAAPASLRFPAAVAKPADETLVGRGLADKIKQRSTLVGLVEPLGVTVGLISHPAESLQILQSLASSLAHGHLGGAQKEVTRLVDHALNPEGVGGVLYKSGLSLKAAADGAVGGLEIYQGLKNRDRFLALIGAADVASGISAASVAAGQPVVGLSLSLVSAASKTALVLTHPDQYSRIQKVKTLFDAGGAVSGSMLRAGLLVGPALALGAVMGPTQMLYMNSDKFRARADHVIDWVLEHLHRPS